MKNTDLSAGPTRPLHPAIWTALPTQAEAAYWIILFTLLGALLAGLAGSSPIQMLPVVLSMLILPLRALLSQADKEVKNQDRAAAEQLRQEGVLQRLGAEVASLANLLEHRHSINLIISPRPYEARAAGSWRRHYIVLGAAIARRLDADLHSPDQQDKARGLLLHEIAHLRHRDVQRIGYTRELLRSCFVILPWWMLFLTGWLGFAVLSAEAMLHLDVHQFEELDPQFRSVIAPLVELSPAMRAEIIEKMETISFGLVLSFIINAFWPILTMGFVLWLFYWRRMVRAQEYYADWAAASATQNQRAVLNAFGRYPPWARQAQPAAGSWQRLKAIGAHWRLALADQLFQFSPRGYKNADSFYRRLKQLFALHPTYRERFNHLQNPLQINNDWPGVAIAIVALVLALDILLITPLATYHLMSYGTHFASIATFVLLSAWTLPFLITGEPFFNKLLKIILLVFGLRAAFVIFDRLLVIVLAIAAPAVTLDAFNFIILAIARYSRPIASMPVEDPLAYALSDIPLYIAFQLIIPLATVSLLLFLYYYLNKRILAASATEALQSVNWRQRHWLIVLGLCWPVTSLMLLPITDLLTGDTLFTLGKIIIYSSGVAAGIFIWRLLGKSRSLALVNRAKE